MKLQPLWKFSFLSLLLISFWALTPASLCAQELTLTLTPRQQCDLELLMNGAFSPLENFMDQENYESVLQQMRLCQGTLWPMPIVLDVTDKIAQKIEQEGASSCQLALKDSEGFTLAKLSVENIWKPNKEAEALAIYGTFDPSHLGVQYLLQRTGNYYVSGPIEWIQKPLHFDFEELRVSPEALKASFKEKGLERVIGFHSRSILSPYHLRLMVAAAAEENAHLLFHPIIGGGEESAFDDFTRVKGYKSALSYFPRELATFSLLSLATRQAGPKEALWQAIVRKNYGCTHFMIEPSEMAPATKEGANPWYEAEAVVDFVRQYAGELNMEIFSTADIERKISTAGDEESGNAFFNPLSERELKRKLRQDEEISAEMAFPETLRELKKAYPPSSQRGFTLFFTGLSGAGKSTIAKALALKLMELQDRPVTILDGDVIRTHLSSELGFSKEHRSLNVKRVGFVAGEITKNRGIAICAMIAPYAADRNYNRKWIESVGDFIEVYVATPFDVCADRDTKGFYQQVKEGKMTGFTGFDDPYQAPEDPEILIDTTRLDISQAVDVILDYLRAMKYIF